MKANEPCSNYTNQTVFDDIIRPVIGVKDLQTVNIVVNKR